MTTPTHLPSASTLVVLVVRRELGHYFRTWLGYVYVAMLLLITGALYNAWALGTGAKYSADVLGEFINVASGTTMIVALLLSMRVFAEERQTGSHPLLATAPLTDGQLVLAKFLSAYLMVAIYILTTVYMPALIFVKGSVSTGHIFAGYVGLLGLGAASTAIGVFGSAIGASQLVAVIISGAILVGMLVLWLVARLVDGALGDVIAYLALHHKHFRPFMDGTIALSDLVFYASVTLFFLTLARNVLEGRRSRS